MSTMNRRKRITALVASTIALAGVFAGTAEPVSAYGTVDTNTFKIQSSGFDFGGDTFAAGAPTNKASVDWVFGWWGNRPEVSGTIHLENVTNNCSRIKVRSYDDDGNWLSPNDFSSEVCASSNGHVSLDVDVSGRPAATKVQVVLQSKLDVAGAKWGKVKAKTIHLADVLKVDDVQISEPEVDFGDGAFVSGTLADPGTLTWNREDYRPWASLTGTMAMKQADDLCARMRLELSSSTYGVQSNVYGTERCVFDDDLHTFSINLGNAVQADSYTDEVRVIIEARPNGGIWAERGSYVSTLP